MREFGDGFERGRDVVFAGGFEVLSAAGIGDLGEDIIEDASRRSDGVDSDLFVPGCPGLRDSLSFPGPWSFESMPAA